MTLTRERDTEALGWLRSAEPALLGHKGGAGPPLPQTGAGAVYKDGLRAH